MNRLRNWKTAPTAALLCLLTIVSGCADGEDAKLSDLRAQGVLFTLDDDGEIWGVYLYSSEAHPFADDDLVFLNDLPSLKLLLIESRRMTDAGLEHVKKLSNLEELDLTFCRGTIGDDGTAQGGITDQGLEYLKGMTGLKRLGLQVTRVSDAAIEELQLDLPNCEIRFDYSDPILAAITRHRGDVVSALQELGADLKFDDEQHVVELKMQVTDAAMKYVGRLDTLTALTIRGVFTSQGISRLKNLSQLQTLDMAGRRNLYARDLEILASLSRLRLLDLSGNRMIDDDLKLLEKLSALETLKVEDCQIEKGTLTALLQALPNCEIVYSKDPLLNALLNHEDDIVAAVEAIAHSVDRSDDGKLLGIEFRHSPISDEGLRELGRLPDLRRLNFTYCRKITDYGLELLGRIDNLENLTLSSTNITSRALATIGTFSELTVLDLTLSKKIDDAGMRDLAAAKELIRLSLRGTGVSDSGIEELSGLTKLQSLDLRGTPVTSEGVNRLKSKLPNCAIKR